MDNFLHEINLMIESVTGNGAIEQLTLVGYINEPVCTACHAAAISTCLFVLLQTFNAMSPTIHPGRDGVKLDIGEYQFFTICMIN